MKPVTYSYSQITKVKLQYLSSNMLLQTIQISKRLLGSNKAENEILFLAIEKSNRSPCARTTTTPGRDKSERTMKDRYILGFSQIRPNLGPTLLRKRTEAIGISTYAKLAYNRG